MTIWVHRPMPDLDGEEHVDEGSCWCNPLAIADPMEAIQLANTIAHAALALLEDVPDDL